MKHTDIVDFLRNADNENFIRAALCYSEDAFKRLSYFEKFSCICDSLPFVMCNHIGINFLDALKSRLKNMPSYDELKERDVQKAVWIEINGGNADNNRRKIPCRMDSISSVTEHKTVSEDNFNINNYFLKNKDRELPQTFDKLLCELKETVKKQKDVILDMSDLEYFRPDEYHALRAYNMLKGEVDCESIEYCVMILHALCILMAHTDVELHILYGEDISKIYNVLDLFEKRKIVGRIKICFDITRNQDLEALFLILLKYPQKNISSEIIIPEEISDKNMFCDLVSLLDKIPVSRLSTCSFLTSEISFKRFSNALDLFLTDRNIMDEDKIQILDSFLM